jgi:hypothetical protein
MELLERPSYQPPRMPVVVVVVLVELARSV